MTATLLDTTARADSPYARRARYPTPENFFSFAWPTIPPRQFLAERERAYAPDAPTGVILLDSSDVLGTAYPATTPTLLTRYIKLRANDSLASELKASGEIYYVLSGSGQSRNGEDTIHWRAGDGFCFPGGGRTTHIAGDTDCLLVCTANEPLLAFDKLRPPAAGAAVVQATHWLREEIDRRFEEVWSRPESEEASGYAVQFSSQALEPCYNTSSTINTAINSLVPGGDQRAHRHNGVAVTLALQGDGVYSMIDGQRVDCVTGAVQITPPAAVHSHHNRGSKRMLALIFQDEALHQYTRTAGFSFC